MVFECHCHEAGDHGEHDDAEVGSGFRGDFGGLFKDLEMEGDEGSQYEEDDADDGGEIHAVAAACAGGGCLVCTMGAGGEDRDGGEHADAEDERDVKQGVGEGEDGHFSDAEAADHEGIGDAEEHLADLADHEGDGEFEGEEGFLFQGHVREAMGEEGFCYSAGGVLASGVSAASLGGKGRCGVGWGSGEGWVASRKFPPAGTMFCISPEFWHGCSDARCCSNGCNRDWRCVFGAVWSGGGA